jgi:hypothetical protein
LYSLGSEGRINVKNGIKKADILIRFSEFEIPPMQDVLIVGRKAPIGPEAARRIGRLTVE